jgi:cytochrome c-type biogenesis protein CcmH/NrfF
MVVKHCSHDRRSSPGLRAPASRVGLLVLVGLGITIVSSSAEAESPSPSAAAVVLGIDTEKPVTLAPEAMEQARAIGREVVCLCETCPRLTITDCGCGWAQTNKKTIEHALAQGQSRAEIIQAYREAYGSQVMAMVPNEGLARLSYLVPYATTVLGLIAVVVVGRRMRRRQEDETKAPLDRIASSDDDEISPELLNRVDEALEEIED